MGQQWILRAEALRMRPRFGRMSSTFSLSYKQSSLHVQPLAITPERVHALRNSISQFCDNALKALTELLELAKPICRTKDEVGIELIFSIEIINIRQNLYIIKNYKFSFTKDVL